MMAAESANYVAECLNLSCLCQASETCKESLQGGWKSSVLQNEVSLFQLNFIFFFFWHNSFPRPAHLVMAFSFTRFLAHTQRRTTVCRTPLDEWSAGRRDLYLTTHNPNNRQTSMSSLGFEDSVRERPQTYALDRPAHFFSEEKQFCTLFHTNSVCQQSCVCL